MGNSLLLKDWVNGVYRQGLSMLMQLPLCVECLAGTGCGKEMYYRNKYLVVLDVLSTTLWLLHNPNLIYDPERSKEVQWFAEGQCVKEMESEWYLYLGPALLYIRLPSSNISMFIMILSYVNTTHF